MKVLSRVGTSANPTWTEDSINNKLLSAYSSDIRWESGVRPRKVLTQENGNMVWNTYNKLNGYVYTNYLALTSTITNDFYAYIGSTRYLTTTSTPPSSSLGYGNYLKISNPSGKPLFIMATKYSTIGIVGYAMGIYNDDSSVQLTAMIYSQAGNVLSSAGFGAFARSDGYGDGIITRFFGDNAISISGWQASLIGVVNNEPNNVATSTTSSNYLTYYYNGSSLSWYQTDTDCLSLTRPAYDDGGPGGRGGLVGYGINGMPVCFYQINYGIATGGGGPMSGTGLGLYSGLTLYTGITLVPAGGENICKRQLYTSSINNSLRMSCTGIGLTTV